MCHILSKISEYLIDVLLVPIRFTNAPISPLFLKQRGAFYPIS